MKDNRLWVLVIVLSFFAILLGIVIIDESITKLVAKIEPFPSKVWIKPYSIAESTEKQWVLTLEWVFMDLDSASKFCEQLLGWSP